MKFNGSNGNVLRKSVLLLLVMALPVFAAAQKPSAPHPSAPAPHPSAPASHPAAPAHQSAPARPSAPSHSAASARPSTNTHASTAARPGTTAHTNTAAKPGTTASRTGSSAQNKTASNTKPGAGRTTPSKTGAPAGKSTVGKNNEQRPGGGTGELKNASTKESMNSSHGKLQSKSLPGGGKATTRANGQIKSIDKNGMHIDHNLHGGRKVVSDNKKTGTRVASDGKHRGYTQKPLTTKNGHKYFARTTVDHGRTSSGVYRGYSYGGHDYYGYQPASYFGVGFYGWAEGGWGGGIGWDASAWGWDGAPWLGFYGFNPYAVYASPAFWLTDYLIAANLQAAYLAAAEGLGGGISVIANQPWNDTGIQVVQGQTYTITADGIAYFAGDDASAVTPAGQPHPSGPNSLAPGLVAYSLVGKIDPAGVPFQVGPHKRFIAQASGELFLGMNDDVNAFNDNRAAWTVNFTPLGGGESSGGDSASASAAPTGSDPVILTPEVKQAIAEEVKAQIEAEKTAAAGGSSSVPQPTNASGEIPPALDPAYRNFVVNSDLSVVSASDGQECALTQGDVITRLTDAPDADNKVNASVGGTKKSDCGTGKLVAVSVDDLQEMRNHFQESVDDGLKTMAKKQGTHGMPKSPSTAQVASDIAPPPPDSTAIAQLQAQQADADQTEAQVRQQTSNGSAGGEN